MKIFKTVGIVAVAALGLLTASCNQPKATTTPTSGVLTMMCDDSFQNIMDQEIEVFEYNYDKAHILCRYAPQSDVLDSLFNFRTTTAVISRELTESEMAHLRKDHRTARQKQIAVDAVALIVNSQNPLPLLTTDEVADVLSGRDSLWTDLWPSDLKKINVYVDHGGSSTVQFMRDKVLKGAKFGANVHAQGTMADVFKAVERDRNALGIVGVSWLTTDMDSTDMPADERRKRVAEMAERTKTNSEIVAQETNFVGGVKVLSIRRSNEMDAYKPYQQYIYDGKYPFTRQIYMVTTSPSGTLAGGFYAYVTGWDGQKIISMTGIMPARVQVRKVELKR